MVMTMDIDEIRQRLEQDLRTTGTRLRERGWPVDPRQLDEATPTAGPAGDPFDRIQATETREGDLLSRERLADRLDRIVEALRRIQDGSYGTCTECDEPIGWGRLRAIPEATLCVRCQERMEPVAASRPRARPFYASPTAGLNEPDDD